MKKSIIAISLGLLSIFQLMADNDFVKGADVGFLPMQERFGQKFYDNSGNERECLDLLQDYGISAVRLRVWVNPKNGSNGKEEVLELAKRAKAKGMDIMLSFHYSDSWSDPAKQPIPHDWMGHSYEEMKQDIANHTVEVLTLLKDNGITPRWAQVNNGFDPELYDRNLGTILKYGGNFDMIGMSLYPYWAMQSKREPDAEHTITDCMANIRRVSQKFDRDVMIVETGYEVDESRPEIMLEGRDNLKKVIREAKNETGGRCKGVFYWEPQCVPGGYKLGAFSSTFHPHRFYPKASPRRNQD